jgi:hypothetical protein
MSGIGEMSLGDMIKNDKKDKKDVKMNGGGDN